MLCYFAFYYYYSHVFSLPYKYIVVVEVDDAPTAVLTNTPSINEYDNQFCKQENQLYDCCVQFLLLPRFLSSLTVVVVVVVVVGLEDAPTAVPTVAYIFLMVVAP